MIAVSNLEFLEALFADPDAWCFTTLSRSETLDDVMWREPVLARA